MVRSPAARAGGVLQLPGLRRPAAQGVAGEVKVKAEDTEQAHQEDPSRRYWRCRCGRPKRNTGGEKRKRKSRKHWQEVLRPPRVPGRKRKRRRKRKKGRRRRTKGRGGVSREAEVRREECSLEDTGKSPSGTRKRERHRQRQGEELQRKRQGRRRSQGERRQEELLIGGVKREEEEKDPQYEVKEIEEKKAYEGPRGSQDEDADIKDQLPKRGVKKADKSQERKKERSEAWIKARKKRESAPHALRQCKVGLEGKISKMRWKRAIRRRGQDDLSGSQLKNDREGRCYTPGDRLVKFFI